MESVASSPPRQTEDITSRVTRLEMASYYEKLSTQAQLDDLNRRLSRLELAPLKALDNSGYLKIALALALPVTVFLLTGSVEKAANAARLVSGH